MAGPATNNLTPRQQKVLAALMSCSSISAAAQLSKVPQRTIFRFLKDESFAACYRAARADALDQAIAQLERLALKSAQTLESIMDNEFHRASSRVAACRTVLSAVLKDFRVEIEDGDGSRDGDTRPKLDLSKLSDEEFEQFSALYDKCRPYVENHTPPLPPYTTFGLSPKPLSPCPVPLNHETKGD